MTPITSDRIADMSEDAVVPEAAIALKQAAEAAKEQELAAKQASENLAIEKAAKAKVSQGCARIPQPSQARQPKLFLSRRCQMHVQHDVSYGGSESSVHWAPHSWRRMHQIHTGLARCRKWHAAHLTKET
jgi:hypothetical protein